MQLAKPALPPPDELQAEIARTLPTKPVSTVYDPMGHAAFAGIGTQKGRKTLCYNCDSIGHGRSDCEEPPAK